MTFVRTRLTKSLGTRAIYVALLEDLVAVVGCIWIVSRFYTFAS